MFSNRSNIYTKLTSSTSITGRCTFFHDIIEHMNVVGQKFNTLAVR